MLSIDDGTPDRKSLAELCDLGCTRSSHVGLLANDNTTLAPLLVGMRVVFGEFPERAGDPDYDVCTFPVEDECGKQKFIKISSEHSAWPPLSSWDEAARREIAEKSTKFGDLALTCSSPFSFHLAATKRVFSNPNSICLSSTNILHRIKHLDNPQRRFIRLILEALAEPARGKRRRTGGRPKTFFRVVDEDGRSWRRHRVTRSHDNGGVESVEFRNGYCVSMPDIVTNVEHTFLELAAIEKNPSLVLTRRPRVILDTAFYVALYALLDGRIAPRNETDAANSSDELLSYHLAGNEMMHYLLKSPATAGMYQAQVANVLRVLKPLFDCDLPLRIKLISPISSVGANQYGVHEIEARLETSDIGQLRGGETRDLSLSA